MTRRTINGSRAVVTGASSGIGRELVRELSRQGADVLLTARREERLQQLVDDVQAAGGKACCLAGDITDPATRIHLLQQAESCLGGLDILVNNAGVGAIGPFSTADEDRLRQIMEVNFFAPAELIRAALPLLRSSQSPIIVNIGSVLGHRAVPGKSEYCASKFALHGFSDALRAELSREEIDLLLVSPSTTQSEFFDNVMTSTGGAPRVSSGQMSAKLVARKTVRAIRSGRHEVILSAGGKLLVWFDRLCPPFANRLLARFG